MFKCVQYCAISTILIHIIPKQWCPNDIPQTICPFCSWAAARSTLAPMPTVRRVVLGILGFAIAAPWLQRTSKLEISPWNPWWSDERCSKRAFFMSSGRCLRSYTLVRPCYTPVLQKSGIWTIRLCFWQCICSKAKLEQHGTAKLSQAEPSRAEVVLSRFSKLASTTATHLLTDGPLLTSCFRVQSSVKLRCVHRAIIVTSKQYHSGRTVISIHNSSGKS